MNIVTTITNLTETIPNGSRFNNTLVELPISGILIAPRLNVNGLVYNLDNSGNTGFSISYGTNDVVSMSWDFIDGNGFSLADTDNIVLHYAKDI